ncbi:hypothetical protein FRB94_005638 [Tulasnella sp. JGI-2019a]|nr:hypothetical protein FRB93_005282 [Tulasnella sp. JGI-2019a]KAG9000194.1 hypothetical protein FRB94_005638 [Tulasnella sp. JGI-2019a]
MPLFGQNNTTSNQTQAGSLARNENDPTYNNERGLDQHAASGQLAGYMVPGVGLVTAQQAAQMEAINYEHKGHGGPLGNNIGSGTGMGPGHQNNAIPQGGMTQGTNVPVQGDPMYDNQRGSVAKRGAEGAALGGLAGHQGHHGHTGRDAAVLGAGGAAYEHEHNKHHHNAQAGNTGGVGTGGLSSGTHNQIGNSNQPDLAEAKRLEKSAKMEKIVGTLTGNTAKKQDALEKKAEAAAIREQVRHISNAEQLEAQAQRARGVAVGMGAHPSVAGGRAQGTDSI